MIFETTSIVWYAAVCGALAVFAPALGGRTVRAMIGAVVGVIAASLLPFIRGMMGY